jgi:DNA-directed RNA polymerase subunit omega
MGTFLLVNIAAQRARQLMQGAAPLVRTGSRKPAAIAIREVNEGLVAYSIPSPEELSAAEAFTEPEEGFSEAAEMSEAEEAEPTE